MRDEAENWRRAAAATGGGSQLTVVLGGGESAAAKAYLAERSFAAEVVTLDCERHGGRVAALKAAVQASRGEFVYLVDANPIAALTVLPRFLAEMSVRGADVVVGSKRHRESEVDYPRCRRLLSWVYHALVRLGTGLRLTDTRTGLRLYRRAVLVDALGRSLAKTHAFDLELLTVAAQRTARLAEAPVVEAAARSRGAYRWPRWRELKEIVKDTLAVFYRRRILDYYARCLVASPLDHEPLVTVVIACPAPSWMLSECLAALARQTYRRWEAIVLPDAPVTADAPAGVRYLATGKVRPAEKRNLGIREAKGEIIAFIDDDAYPEAHWLEYAVRYFGEPTIGAVGGPGVTPPGDCLLAQVGGAVYDNFLVSGNYRYRYRAGGVRMDVEDYPSCNLLVWRDLLLEIGGYRTDFWPGEDTLLCKDIIDRWRRIVYDPWVIVFHHRRPLFRPHLRQLGRYGFHRGYFVKRFPSNSRRAAYFVPSAFVFYLAAFAVLAPLLPRFALALAAAPLAVYALAVALTSADWRLHRWVLTALGVVLSHLWYGVEFMRGLLARRAPCEFIGGDHGSAHGASGKEG